MSLSGRTNLPRSPALAGVTAYRVHTYLLACFFICVVKLQQVSKGDKGGVIPLKSYGEFVATKAPQRKGREKRNKARKVV